MHWPCKCFKIFLQTSLCVYLILHIDVSNSLWYNIYVFMHFSILSTFTILMHICAYIISLYKVWRSSSRTWLDWDCSNWSLWLVSLHDSRAMPWNTFIDFMVHLVSDLYVVYGSRHNHSYGLRKDMLDLVVFYVFSYVLCWYFLCHLMIWDLYQLYLLNLSWHIVLMSSDSFRIFWSLICHVISRVYFGSTTIETEEN